MMTLDTGSLDYSIKVQKLSVRRVQLYYNNLEKINETEGGRDHKLGNASIDLELADMKLDDLKKTLESSIL